MKIQEVILGGEFVITKEFVEGAMKLIRTRFNDHLHDGAAILAVFGGVRRGLNSKLFERVDGGREGGGVHAGFGGDNAIEGDLLIDFALAVGADGDAVARNGEAAGAINMGVPFVLSQTQSEVATTVRALAQSLFRLSTSDERPKPKKRFMLF